MRRRYLLPGCLALLAAWALTTPPRGRSAPPATPTFTKDVLPFLKQHCFACHGNGKNRAGLSLDRFKDDESVQQDRKVWENVQHMLRSGEMPPREKPRPPAAAVEAAVQSIEAVLAAYDCSKPRSAGRVTLRRLNRIEYNNTIRDLVGIHYEPTAAFPADDVGYGFDNIGDVLSLSPLLLERYLGAAEEILDKALVVVETPKPVLTRLSGMRVSRGAGETSRRGAFLNGRGSASVESHLEEGDYVVRIEAYGQQAGDEPVRAAIQVNRNDVQTFDVKATESAPATLEAKVRLRTGTARVGLAFLNPFREEKADDQNKRERLLYVRSISVDGPYNAPPPIVPESTRRILAHREGTPPREAAREIVARFATRAFRRPVQAAEVERFLKLYDEAEKAGERFEDRVRLALYRVLVSPHFLFRVELDLPNARVGQGYPIGEYELASRLSYFLWSTMPDEELFALAGKGQLRQQLDAQLRRMLQDTKSSAFVQNFAGQWLMLRKLATVAPDTKVFPRFDDDLRFAMQRETELFFEAILREDRSILDFIDADFSFVNGPLARHYGIEGIHSRQFQRVKLPSNRGGILTHASILTLTSNSTRTSPVNRGKWVLDQVLNTPPPPPPPDVPPLEENRELKGSLRKIMEQHRENALCASCHNRMDPIGFAFENYDAIGAWRDRDGKFPIDPSGVLPDGQVFQGPAELKKILKGKKELFARCLTEKVLTYALGRGLEFYDRCAVDKVIEALAKNEYRFSTLLLGVVRSEPFQMRTAAGGKP